MDKEEKWIHVVETIGKTFSTCVRRQYGAVIIASNGRIIGMGYNGSAPNGIHCNEGGCPRVQADVEHGSNYENCIAVHAEANAIIWSDPSMRTGSTLVVNGPPCFGCAKLIASSGISKVVCKYDEEYSQFDAIILFLESLNIQVKVVKNG